MRAFLLAVTLPLLMHPASGMARDAAVEEEWVAAAEKLRREALDFRVELDRLAEQRYEARKASVISTFDRAIDRLEIEEKKERIEAMAALERFIARYPAHPKQTPDALIRLAELYYERSQGDAAEAMRGHEAALRAFEAGSGADPGEPPKGDYGKSIELYRRILAHFPGSKNGDMAQYLLAYCLGLEGEEAESRNGYLALIEGYPDSRFVPEAWMRLGEYYFVAFDGDPNENLRRAADAYGRMLAYPDHPLFDKALYKLGWTFYRLDEFESAVGAFVRLVDHYAAKNKSKGKDEMGGDLRGEALQYTAISFADEGWGGLARAVAYFGSLGGRSWEHEIYRRMGDLFTEMQRKDASGKPAAVDAYKLALQRAPFAADAPQLQAKIIAAYSRERMFADEARERDVLVEAYSEGGRWFEQNRDDPKAIELARALTEEVVKVAAVFHHAQAQERKKEGRLAEAAVEYAAAARGYGEYLRRFPNARDLYEVTYFLAECLYESGEVASAAPIYERVRDFEGEDKYRADAAFAAVLAYQKAMEQEIAAGRVPPPKALTSKERGDVPVQLRPISPTMARFVAAADAHVERSSADERSPAIAFKAAELYYAHDDFDEARRRFEEVIVQFPKDPVAQSAANLIIESYLVAKDWANVQAATAKLLERKDLELAPELRGSLTTFKLGAIFQQANEAMEAGRFEEAAAEYLRLVKERPDHEFADKALNNAAVSFENAERFDSAMKTYERIIAEYPKSSFADAALFRVAENARKSYDFDKAVRKYEQLVRDYPNSKERANALNNVAVLLVGLQRYDEGARAYQRFAELFPDDPDAAKNQYRAAAVYERQEDWRRLVPALEAFARRFGKDPKQNALVVEARLKIAKAHEKLGNERAARAAYRDCTVEFDDRYRGATAEPAASAAAAECAFRLAEYDFAAWDRLKIEGSKKALEASFLRKKEAVPELKDRYLDVAKYKNVDWTLAAFYRKAYVLERLANAFFEAPIPPEVKRLGPEAEDLYRGRIAEAVVALEEGAVKDYQETLDQARRFGIANEWTRRTLESLNRYRPKEYPILKEARVRLATDGAQSPGLATLPTGFSAPTVTPTPGASGPMKLGGAGAGQPGGGAPVLAPLPASSSSALMPLPAPGASGLAPLPASSSSALTPLPAPGASAPLPLSPVPPGAIGVGGARGAPAAAPVPALPHGKVGGKE